MCTRGEIGGLGDRQNVVYGRAVDERLENSAQPLTAEKFDADDCRPYGLQVLHNLRNLRARCIDAPENCGYMDFGNIFVQ